MTLTNLQRFWRHAAQERDLRIQTPYVLTLADGTQLTVEVLLEEFGAQNGMIIVSDFSLISEHTDAIVAAGFGYTCMSQPPETEISSLAGVDACLADWKAEGT